MKYIIIFFLFFLFSVGLTMSQNYVWTQKANFGGGTRYGPFSFSIGTSGYTGSGVGFSGPNIQWIYTDLWKYDQPSDTWVQLANHPGPCRKEPSGFSIGDKGYVTVGWSSANQLGTTMKYDTITNTWSSATNFGGSPRYTASQFVIGNYAYVGTGFTPYSADFWRYDPANDAWTQVADIGGIPRQAAVGFSIGSFGYVFGGDQQNVFYSNDLWRYDPAANSWTQMTSCPCAGRGAGFAFAFNGKGFIGGGTNEVVTFQDFYEYDPLANSWIQRADYGGGPIIQPFYFSIGNRGYVGAGSSDFYPNINLTSQVWEWGPEQKSTSVDNIYDYSESIYIGTNGKTMYVMCSVPFENQTTLKLFDVSGKMLRRYDIIPGNKFFECPLQDIPNGTILYLIETKKSKIKSGKLILT